MSEAKLLIVDEVTLGLHNGVHDALFDVVKSLAEEGRACIVVDESTSGAARVADYVYVLNGGRVVGSGVPRAVGKLEVANE